MAESLELEQIQGLIRGALSLPQVHGAAVKMCLCEIFQDPFPEICVFFSFQGLWTKSFIQKLYKEH